MVAILGFDIVFAIVLLIENEYLALHKVYRQIDPGGWQ